MTTASGNRPPDHQRRRQEGLDSMTEDATTTYTELHTAMRRLGGAVPEVVAGLTTLEQAAMTDGKLPRATKELIALAVALVLPEDRLIPTQVRDALAAGATEQQVLEAAGVAVFMGGAGAAVRAGRVAEAVRQAPDDAEQREHQRLLASAAEGAGLGHLFHGQDGDDLGLG
jgi:alkylhydroperoxidase/carboxymuconolactone decarboxylase family protein YurZ